MSEQHLRNTITRRESSSFTSSLCHGCILWRRRVFSRISERGLWWYDYRAIQAFDRWLGARSHCNREFPWDLKSRVYCKRLRVASMWSNRRDTLRWMLSRNVSIFFYTWVISTRQCHDLVLYVVLKKLCRSRKDGGIVVKHLCTVWIYWLILLLSLL